MAFLVLSRGKKRLLEWPLRSSRILVGRSDNCDLVVPADGVSRTHCILSKNSNAWVLRDRSKHGTFVQGQPVNGSVTLKDGQCIQIGPFFLYFRERESFLNDPTVSRPIVSLPVGGISDSNSGGNGESPFFLRAISDDQKRVEHLLVQGLQSIGSEGSDLEISGEGVVRDHCFVHVNRGRLILNPSKGETFVGDEALRSPIPIFPGESFRLGSTRFEVVERCVPVGSTSDRFGEMIAQNEEMRTLFGSLRTMAPHSAPVLLIGESGTGKELAARGLHKNSPRSKRRFVALNCSAISEKLFESELFGHEKGAFTDAKERRDGAFHQADGGTLFLDEIGELPLAAQAKLLRVLETGEVRRVGGDSVSFPVVRVVAATNRDLEEEVENGRFREDLYFRLAVLGVRIPPLRERKEDIKLLARRICASISKDIRLGNEAILFLERHDFPGNVRELKNILTRAYVLGGPSISVSSIQINPWNKQYSVTQEKGNQGILRTTEERILREAFFRHEGNCSSMARDLGVPRTTLIYKLRRFGLSQKKETPAA